jgi:hypothetical protein
MIFSFCDLGGSCPLTKLNPRRGNPASHEKTPAFHVFILTSSAFTLGSEIEESLHQGG